MPLDGLRRAITDEEIARYETDGVVHLRGVLSDEWVDKLRGALDDVDGDRWNSQSLTYDLTGLADMVRELGADVLTEGPPPTAASERGRFRSSVGSWIESAEVGAMCVASPFGAIAGTLMRTGKVNLYGNQILIKEPGARELTAFHTDENYFHLVGDEICSVWASPDPVGADASAMRYVRGSHRWPQTFRPNTFISQDALYEDADQEPLPDIEGHADEYDIVTCPSEPGDVLVHHHRTVHGAGPNLSADVTRRALSAIYVGDQVRFRRRASAPPVPPGFRLLDDGDVLDGEQYPVVWRR